MTTNAEVQCPKCSGTMWDNRATKRNPKQPDFKCKDKACDGVIWPPKNGAPAPAAAQPKQAYSAGPHIPAIDGPYLQGERVETGAPPVVNDQQNARLNGLFTLYATCLNEVLASAAPRLLKADIGTTPEAIAAMTATLFIAAKG